MTILSTREMSMSIRKDFRYLVSSQAKDSSLLAEDFRRSAAMFYFLLCLLIIIRKEDSAKASASVPKGYSLACSALRDER